MATRTQTSVPSKHVVLYDGLCRFCTAQSKNLVALAKPGSLEAIDFQQPGVLDRFPGLTYQECMRAMQLVTPEGRVYQGFEAAVQAVATRPQLWLLVHAYYLPGLRQLCDWLYRFIASRRYRLMGKTVGAGKCENRTCGIHGGNQVR